MSRRMVVWFGIAFGLFVCSGSAADGLPERPPGVVVAESPEPGRVRVASPSIVKLADGGLVVSHDWSGRSGAMSSVYRSGEGGETWERLADVRGVMWATLFEQGGALYLFGTSGGVNDVVLRRSEDGGRTWTEADDGKSGLIAEGAYHCGPVPVVVAKGRVWKAFERRENAKRRREFTAHVFSAPVGSDLLDAGNWVRSNGVRWEREWLEVRAREWIEGNVVVDPEGQVLNVLRTNTHPAEGGPLEIEDGREGLKRFEVVAAMRVGDDGREMRFDPETDFRSMPGAQSKFTIGYDEVSGRYWSVVSKITAPDLKSYAWEVSPHHQRNVMMLVSSAHLESWEERYTLLSYRRGEVVTKANPIGFQYADWVIDGDDLLVVSRTAWTGARNYHDANFITFHRVEGFREKELEGSPPDLAE